MNKEFIRNKIKQLRSSISYEELKEKSSLICDKFYAKYSSLNTFLMYYPINNEVNILPLINKLFDEGKKIYLPKTYNKEMGFYLFTGFENLKAGAFGVMEPVGNMLEEPADIICMPAVAFDRKCNRVGYGGGYYDRYLQGVDNILKVGIAYSFQLVESIQNDFYDQPVDEIITEQEIVRRTE